MENKNKIYIILTAFALVSLIFVIFCILPLISGIEKSSEDLISAKNNIATLGDQTKGIENFKNNYETYKPNLDKMDQLFIDPANPVDFIKFLEDTAYDSGITSQISLSPYSQGSQQGSIIFQFTSAGSFSDISNFLKKLETSPYLIEIENLTIQNSENSSDTKKNVSKDYSARLVSASFTIKVFTK